VFWLLPRWQLTLFVAYLMLCRYLLRFRYNLLYSFYKLGGLIISLGSLRGLRARRRLRSLNLDRPSTECLLLLANSLLWLLWVIRRWAGDLLHYLLIGLGVCNDKQLRRQIPEVHHTFPSVLIQILHHTERVELIVAIVVGTFLISRVTAFDALAESLLPSVLIPQRKEETLFLDLDGNSWINSG